MPLVLTHAEARIPATQMTGDTWDTRVAARRCAPDVSDYEGLMDLLEGELQRSCLSDDISVARDIAYSNGYDNDPFPVSEGPTQADMAMDVVARLRKRLDADDVCSVPNLLAYASTAVDENFFASVAGRVAAANDISKRSHFGVWQMQGAAFAASLEIAAAMVTQPGEAAFLVASEKWPEPSTRKVPSGGRLGDGACAVRATFFDETEADRSGLIIRATRNVSVDPLLIGLGADDARDDIVSRVSEEAARLLKLNAEVQPNDLTWLPSSFGKDVDTEIAKRVGGRIGSSESDYAPNTNFCCADGHLAIASILASLSSLPDTSDGQYFIHWGASFGGGLGLTLLQLKTPVKP